MTSARHTLRLGRAARAPELEHREKQSYEQRYQLLELLGRGGAGEVYRARDLQLQRDVAVKLLRDPSLERRFLHEAQAQARVEHEGICRVYEVGRAECGPFLALQLIKGPTLLEAAAALSVEEKVSLMARVARAVHAAHRTGLVHRDLKPGNILVERGDDGTPRPYVTDFGLARDLSDPVISAEGLLHGTPHYMAPEQVSGGPPDRRSDLYGLGATLFELLAGSPPFDGLTPHEVLERVMHEEAPLLRSRAPGLPRDLEPIVARCLARQPAWRYPSALALAEDLERFLGGESPLAASAGPLRRLGRSLLQHPRTAVAGTLALLALVLGLGLTLRERQNGLRRAAVAERFGARTREMESILRFAYLQQLHDTRLERRQVLERLELIDQERRSLGELGEGPALYAQGRGYLALEENGKALQALQAAWNAGYRSPEAAYGLGLALGSIYRSQSASASLLGSPEAQRARLAELGRLYRDPAIAYLQQAGGADAPELASAELAFDQERYDDALAAARKVLGRSPGLYEAQILEGDVQRARALAARVAGNLAAAEIQYRAAAATFTAAALQARSDPRVHLRLCGTLTELLTLRSLGGRGGDLEAPRREAEEACANASAAGADGPALPALRAAMGYAVAVDRARRGKDPGPELSAALAQAQRAQELDLEDPRPWHQAGLVLEQQALWALRRGGDALTLLDRAAQALEHERALGGVASADASLGRVLWHRADALERMGRDPREALRGAAERLRGEAPSPGSLGDLAAVLLQVARWQSRHGDEAGPTLDEAHRVAAEGPGRPGGAQERMRLGLLLADQAEWLLHQGREPKAQLDEARRALESALPGATGAAPARLLLVRVERLAAEWELLSSRDPTASVQRARERLSGLTAPGSPEPAAERAALALIEARWELDQGRPGSTQRAEATRELAAALRLDARCPETLQRAVEKALLDARAAALFRRRPEPALREAEAALERAHAPAGADARIHTLEAELRLRQAHALLARRADPTAVARAGVAAAQEALAIDSRAQEALWLRGMLRQLAEPGDPTALGDVERAVQALPHLMVDGGAGQPSH